MPIKQKRRKLKEMFKIITLIPMLGIISNCATSPTAAEMSKTVNDYVENTSITNKNGEKIYDQYVIKALMLYHIIEGTKWPDGKKNNVRLCMIGEDYFRGKLRKMASLIEKEEGVKWHIQYGARPSDIKYSCDVLFAGFMYSDRELRDFLSRSNGKPILTVGEDKYFAYHGGMVEMKTENNKISISINEDKIKEANLKIDNDLVEFSNKN